MNIYEKVFHAVQEHAKLDKEQFEDIAKHGADAGWPGFTYYSDTVAFFDRNKSLILDLVKEETDSMGMDNEIVFIKGFNCLNGDYNDFEVAKGIYEDDSDSSTTIRNALVWFALETVAYLVDDGMLDNEFK